jgi:polar amino acid transport system substrate-binding protein
MLLVVAALILSACGPTTPQTVEVTRVVAGTPQQVIVTAPAAAAETLLDKVKRTKSLVIGTGSYPPTTMVDPKSGEWVGYDQDLLIAFAKSLGADPFITYMPASALVPALQSDRIDIWVDLYKTEERAKALDFSDVWTCYADAVVVNSEKPTVASATVADMKGKKIATCRGCAEEKYIDNIQGADKALYDTVEESLLEVSTGRVDAAFQPTVYVGWGQKQNPDWKIKTIGLVPTELIPEGVQATPSYFGVKKGSQSETFLSQLNAFIKDWRDSGKMKDSFAKYGLTDPSFFSPTCK